MMKKLVFTWMVFFSAMALAKDAGTGIGSYVLPEEKLRTVKKFTNETDKFLKLTWQISAFCGDVEFKDFTILAPKDHAYSVYRLDLAKTLNKARAQKIDNCEKYDLKLFLEVAPKDGKGGHKGMDARPLKRSEKGDKITQKEFVNSDSFEFVKSKQGKISYKVVS